MNQTTLEPQKRQRGRPSLFTSVNMEHVKFLVLHGCTDAEICKFLKINNDTFCQWKIKHQEFAESLKNWKINADERVERSLYQLAVGFDGAPPNVVACIFWLKNRQPLRWRDKQESPEDERLKDSYLQFNDTPAKDAIPPRVKQYIQN